MLDYSVIYIQARSQKKISGGGNRNFQIFNSNSPRSGKNFDVFNVKNFEQLIILEQENIEMSDYDLNNRVLNIINQVRKDNFGYTQPLVILTMK